MADKKMVINGHTFKNNVRCQICGREFTGNGFQEKCIAGYTPEGYLYATRTYCDQCGEERMAQLVSEGRQFTPQFPEE
ncbi:MAG: hypothetical protein IJM63_05385 [Solobacterium sp.]|nr:hypothetical protein [Solobacterium sp.]